MNCAKCNISLNNANTYRKGNRFHSYCKKCFNIYTQERWCRIKTILVIEKGGVCEECGKTGHPSIFDFHHIDGNDKLFNISNKRQINITKLRTEVEKCILLCACCHRVKHINNKLWNFDLNEPYFKTKQSYKCKKCDKKISISSKYCSKLCAAKAKEKIIWPINLQELVNNSSKKAVATILGVSDKAIAKRLKNHHAEV